VCPVSVKKHDLLMEEKMSKIFSIITVVLLILTLGCGFAIHFGGENFQNAIKGHMVLALLTVISGIILLVSIFK
jgi:hypothetical protein